MEDVDYLIRKTKAEQIVVVAASSNESPSGHVEHSMTKVACRIGKKPVILSVSRTKYFLPGKTSECGVTDSEISEKEYARLVEKHGPILDTPAVRARIANEDVEAARRAANLPRCPKCRSEMVKRTGPRGRFWGCSKYPKCRGSRDVA